MSMTGVLDHLQQVQELNRVFLGLLQSRVREQSSCLGLPAEALPPLRVASPELLDAWARFPRALFRLALDPRSRVLPSASSGSYDEAEHDLCLSILLAMRHTSRYSGYQARLLLGLEAAEIEALTALPLPNLQRLACAPGLLQCAFAECRWFWPALLTATRPEVRRQLLLMALQPRAQPAWPPRKPPQASA
ncbi:MAG TPA: hypothetical protein VIQ99_04795 [Gammaproteobacteria bacterium]